MKEIAKQLLDEGVVRVVANSEQPVIGNRGAELNHFDFLASVYGDGDVSYNIVFYLESVVGKILEQSGTSLSEGAIVSACNNAIGLGFVTAFDCLEVPFAFVQKQASEQGDKCYISGAKIGATHRVVIITDVVRTGKTALEVVKAVRDTGAEVVAVVAVINCNNPDVKKAFDAYGVMLDSLTDFIEVLEAADDEI